MLTHEEIRAHIHAFGLDEYADQILKSVKNAIHIRREQVEDEAIPIGASKLGGSPDVPPDFTWYTYQDTPLTFIGQFRLSEVAPHDVDHLLPERGMLYFFYEVVGLQNREHEALLDATHVLYLPEEDVELRRFPHPTVKNEFRGKTYMRAALPSSQATFLTLTTIEHHLIEKTISDEHIYQRYDELYKKVMQMQGLKQQGDAPPHHWFLGNPTVLQNDPVAELMLERTDLNWKNWHTDAFNVELAHWVLLAQFDSDYLNVRPEWEWAWGDGGIISFCMSRAELAVQDFSKVRCEMIW